MVCCRRSTNPAAIKELSVDGHMGRKTTMALQTLLRNDGIETFGPIDGRFGRRTRRAMKSFLKAHGYDIGMAECSWWGRRSTKALQSWARDNGADPGPLDGWWGCRTTKALQIVLNTTLFNSKSSHVTTAPAKDSVLSDAKAPLLVSVGTPVVADTHVVLEAAKAA